MPNPEGFNQYMHGGASDKAHVASEKANRTNYARDHYKAAKAHLEAVKEKQDQGRFQEAHAHMGMASQHRYAALNSSRKLGT